MAIGKTKIKININKLSIKFGSIKIIEKGQLVNNYDEDVVKEYMKNDAIDIYINLNLGKKNFTAFTMDLSKKYIEINADYRS
jgi:glutamate N-acetyltransferase/amino-acid N-acetyltransferase